MAPGRSFWPSLIACSLVVACGGQTSANGHGAGGAGAGGNGGTAGTSVGGNAGTAGTSVGGAGGAPPNGVVVLDQNEAAIAGARVVVTQPNGSREEQLTDAQGLASFPDIEFANEIVELMAFSAGRTLVSVLDVGPTSSRVVHLYPATEKAQFSRILKLTIKNMVVSDKDCVHISSTAAWMPKDTCGAPIDFPIRPATAGKLIAYEYADPSPTIKAGVVLDIPSTSDNLEIDLAKSEPIEKAAGSVSVTAFGPPDFLVAVDARVTSPMTRGSAQSSLSVSQPNGAGFDWHAEFFRAYPDAEARTVFALGGNNFNPSVSVAGYYPGGPLPALPASVSIGGLGSGAKSVFAPINWTAGSERPDRLTLSVSESNYGWSVWDIWFSPERSSVTLQKPPDSIWNALDWKNATQVVLDLVFCEPEAGACGAAPCTPSQDRWCARRAVFHDSAPYTLD